MSDTALADTVEVPTTWAYLKTHSDDLSLLNDRDAV